MSDLNYDSKIERYDEQTGDLYMRTFGIAEGLVTSNNWAARDVLNYGKTFINRWVIDHEKSKGVHVKFTNLSQWLKASQKAAIATITGVDVNDKTGALDIIYKVTDGNTKAQILDDMKNNRPIKWKFSSPAIWGHIIKRDPEKGTILYDKWEGVHVAVFSKKVNPAYPANIAQINENVCVGGINCANELAAVAVKLEENDEKFTLDKSGIARNPDNIKMVGEEGNSKEKTVPYEEYIGLKEKHDSTNSKLTEALKVNEKLAADKKAKEEAYNELNDKWTAREKEDKKKLFAEKLGKIFAGEELDQKVNFALDKNYVEADIDQLYGPLLSKAEEQEKIAQKDIVKTPKAGIAASNNSKMDHTIRENIDVAISIANQRKRVF